MNYNGSSMQPTLQPGDRLNIMPCSDADLRVGDVVVFVRGDSQKIVHRVVEKHRKGVRTRGDNNSQIDPEIPVISDIFGRVISVKRQDCIISVQGGINGRITGFLLRTKRSFNAALSKSLHAFYHRLSKSGVFTRLLSIRIISFKRENGIENQLLWHQKVIGRHISGEREWKIKRPFRLFVDVENLPKI